MNLALEKKEKVTTGGKSRGEAGEVTGVIANAPTTDGLGRRYGNFISFVDVCKFGSKIYVITSTYLCDHFAHCSASSVITEFSCCL